MFLNEYREMSVPCDNPTGVLYSRFDLIKTLTFSRVTD